MRAAFSIFPHLFQKQEIQEGPLYLPPATTHCMVDGVESRIGVFNSENAMCQDVDEDPEGCDIRSLDLTIDGFAERVRVGAQIGLGTYGLVYQSNFPHIVVKFGLVCSDKAAIKALNNVEADLHIPRAHEITSKISDFCKSRILIMDKIGQQDWFDIMTNNAVNIPLKEGYMRISRMISALKNFHSLGFTHNDLHQKNIRVDRNDPKFIGLIDLGIVSPIDGSRGSLTRISKDLQRLSDHVQSFLSVKRPAITPVRRSFFFSSTAPLADEHNIDWIFDGLELFAYSPQIRNTCANYDLWIWIFETMANSDNPKISDRIRNLLIPTYTSLFENLIRSAIATALHDNEPLNVLKFPRSFRPIIPPHFVSTQTLPKMYSKIVDFITEQKIYDNRYPDSAPYLALNSELIYEANSRGVLEPRVLDIGTSYEIARVSVTYTLDDFKIEYRVNCDHLHEDLLEMQREFWMTKIGSQLGISIAPVWLSPAVKFPVWKTTKIPLELPEEQYQSCAKDHLSQIRYMVTENWGTSIEKSHVTLSRLRPKSRLIIGLEFAIEFVKKFKHLHKKHGIVYGQMRPENVLSKSAQGKDFFFKLDNFGKSFYIAEYSAECYDCHVRSDSEPHTNPCYQTHWNLDGSRLAFRDDIYNVLLVAAWIMTDENRDKNFCSPDSSHRAEDIKNWKTSSFIFGDIVKLVPRSDAPSFTKNLKDVLTAARAVETVDGLPDYKLISKNLKEALAKASKFNV